MESMEGVEDEDSYSEDSDSSDVSFDEDTKKELLWIVQQEKEMFEKVLAKKPWLRK